MIAIALAYLRKTTRRHTGNPSQELTREERKAYAARLMAATSMIENRKAQQAQK